METFVNSSAFVPLTAPSPVVLATRTGPTGPRTSTGPTGPRTAAGKARVSRNALRHGLDATQVVLDDEDAAAFAAYRARLYADWLPVGADECGLLEKMSAAQWRQQRAWKLTVDLHRHLDSTRDEPLRMRTFMAEGEDSATGLTRLDHWESRLDRRYDLALRRLIILQEMRRKGLRPGVQAAPIEVVPELPASASSATPSPESAEQTPATPLPAVGGAVVPTALPPVSTLALEIAPPRIVDTEAPIPEGAPGAGTPGCAPTPEATPSPFPSPSSATPSPESAEQTPPVRSVERPALRSSGAILAAALADPAAMERAAEPPPGLTDHDRRRWKMIQRHPETDAERSTRIRERIAELEAKQAPDRSNHLDELLELKRQAEERGIH